MPTVTLTERLSFPGAFGYGRYATGGRGGTIIPVTTTANSGVGSLREALTTTGARIIVIKISGTLTLTSDIILNSSHDNFTIIGQTAPMQGLTVTGGKLEIDGCTNVVIRHVTWRMRTNGSPGADDNISFPNSGDGSTFYVDHCSASYGFDETISIKSDSYTTPRVTLANCLMAECHKDHNTASLFGANAGENNGKYTWARNMTEDISHRFPNFYGDNDDAMCESYNNLIVNHLARLMRCNDNCKVDFYNNYVAAGNRPKTSVSVNRYFYQGATTFKTYTTGNYVEGFNTNVNQNIQTTLWNHFQDYGPEGISEGDLLDLSMFSSVQLAEGYRSPQGLLTAAQVSSQIHPKVGNSVGTDSNGNPVNGRDSLDARYVTNYLTENTPSDYRDSASWDLVTITTGTPFTDTGSTGIADSFKTTHGLSGDGTNVTTNWNFGSYEVVNTAGYTDREMYWSWVAGDFDDMVETTGSNSSVRSGQAMFIHC